MTNKNEETFYSFYEERIGKIIGVLQQEQKLAFAKQKTLWDSLASGLYKIFHMASIRTLIVELHICKDGGKLRGNNPEEEYKSYCTYLEEKKYRQYIFDKYPGLLAYLDKLEENQITFLRELFLRIKRDGGNLQISSIQWNVSDLHNGGKAVTKLETAEGRHIFYKPRNLGNEILLQDILIWIYNDLGMDMQSVSVLDRGNYGWMNEVKKQECNCLEDIRAFYRRSGILAAVCYVLGIGDMHYENLIACGEYPMIVDAETLLQNMSDLYCWKEKTYYFYSVLSSGLFPGGSADKGVSGITGGKGWYRDRVPVILNDKSSNMQVGYKRPEIRSANNRASFLGEEGDIYKNRNEIQEGFRAAYEWFQRHKEGVRERLGDMSERIVSRYLSGNTQFFAIVRLSSTHPELMQKMDGRQRFLEKICRNRALGIWEKEALIEGDIPIFYRKPKDRNLYLEDGKILKNYFEISLIESFEKRLAKLSEEDRRMQEQILQLSLKQLRTDIGQNERSIVQIKKGEEVKRIDLLKCADDIAQYIAKHKIRKDEKIFWLEIRNKERFQIRPVDIYFYNGIAGISVFFRMLCKKIQKWQKICDELEQELFSYTEHVESNMITMASEYTGMYCGEASIVYTYQLLYKITNNCKYKEYARKHADILIKHLRYGVYLDLLYGDAGTVLVLCQQYKDTGEFYYLKEAQNVLKELEDRKIETDQGITWQEKKEGNSICSIAHGNSGMLLAYARVCSCIYEDKYVTQMQKIIKFENQFWDETSGNWADLKKGKTYYKTYAWCNAGIGVAYARLLAARWNPKELWLFTEVSKAARLFEYIPIRKEMCFCHGNFGNFLILREIADFLQSKKLINVEKRFWIEIKELLLKKNLSDFGGFGLMDGLAGIGLGCLILHQDAFFGQKYVDFAKRIERNG